MSDLDKLLGFLTELLTDPAANACPPSPKATAARAKLDASAELGLGSPLT